MQEWLESYKDTENTKIQTTHCKCKHFSDIYKVFHWYRIDNNKNEIKKISLNKFVVKYFDVFVLFLPLICKIYLRTEYTRWYIVLI